MLVFVCFFMKLSSKIQVNVEYSNNCGGLNGRKVLGSSKVSSSNQVTLSTEVRRKLGVKAGDIVAFYERDDGSIGVRG